MASIARRIGAGQIARLLHNDQFQRRWLLYYLVFRPDFRTRRCADDRPDLERTIVTVNTNAQAFVREALKPDLDRVNRARRRAETSPAGDYRTYGWWIRDNIAGIDALHPILD